ncbi:hypothetical protein ACPC54_28410 [Kitasatospora sp. NPDC094028]
MTSMRGRIAALLGAVAVVAGTTLATPAAPAGAAPGAGITGWAPCPEAPEFSCGTLAVPLDRSGAAPGTLDLQVAVSGNTTAPSDLATPYELLYEQAESAHDPEIVIVPGAAHSVQNRAANPAGRQAVYDFLLG